MCHAINKYQLRLDVQRFLWPVYYYLCAENFDIIINIDVPAGVCAPHLCSRFTVSLTVLPECPGPEYQYFTVVQCSNNMYENNVRKLHDSIFIKIIRVRIRLRISELQDSLSIAWVGSNLLQATAKKKFNRQSFTWFLWSVLMSLGSLKILTVSVFA